MNESSKEEFRNAVDIILKNRAGITLGSLNAAMQGFGWDGSLDELRDMMVERMQVLAGRAREKEEKQSHLEELKVKRKVVKTAGGETVNKMAERLALEGKTRSEVREALNAVGIFRRGNIESAISRAFLGRTDAVEVVGEVHRATEVDLLQKLKELSKVAGGLDELKRLLVVLEDLRS